MSNRNKVLISLFILCTIVFVLGIHGGHEYYFRDFCVHKTLNMFYNSGSPEFFKKPSFVSDIQAIAYWIFYLILKATHIVNNFDDFSKLFIQNMIETPLGKISFMMPALIINNIFAAIGVCFTFLTTYILTNKKIFPSFIAGFILATSYIWMNLSHHLAVDIPLASLCVMTIFFTLYFIQNKNEYTKMNIIVLGLLSGLCASTKYNGAIIILIPAFILFLTRKSKKDFIFNSLLLSLSAAFSFFITNPFILINFPHFWQDFSQEYNHAFKLGHLSADDATPFNFHIFHSIPNAIGTVQFIGAVLGAMFFVKDKQIRKEEKFAFLLFPIVFYAFMSLSMLVFLRYMLPFIPFIAICFGLLINYCKQYKPYKILYTGGLTVLSLILISHCINAVHFYKIVGQNDTRVKVKNVFKTLNIPQNTNIFFSDIFSNPYYEEDFTNQYAYLTKDMKAFFDTASNNSIYVVPSRTMFLFGNYDIIFMDSDTFDRTMQTKKYKFFENIDNQYFMYHPYRTNKNQYFAIEEPMYIIQVNPYKIAKTKVPFNILRSDFKYRKARGPFIEIYFKDIKLRDNFLQNCAAYNLDCTALYKDESYFYNNLTFAPYQFNRN